VSDINLIKLPGGMLAPSLPQDAEKLERWATGEILRAKVSKPINAAFHRKLFALVNVIFEGQERYTEFEHLRDALTIAAGYCDTIILPDGRVTYKPHSWAYAKTGQIEKEQIYSKLIDLGLRDFLPDTWTEDDINYQVERILGFA